jgi:hypothetical protein
MVVTNSNNSNSSNSYTNSTTGFTGAGSKSKGSSSTVTEYQPNGGSSSGMMEAY